MSSIIFFSPRPLDAATLTASSEVASLPVTNLQDQEPTQKFRTESNTAQAVRIELAWSLACNVAGFNGHNMSDTATWRVSGYTTVGNVPGTPAFQTAWQSVWPVTGKPALKLWPHFLSVIQWDNDVEYPVYLIEFTDPDNDDDFIDIGRAAIDRAFQPGLTCDFGSGLGWAPDDVQEATSYGHTFTDHRPYKKRRFTISFGAMDQDEAHDGAMEFARLDGMAGDIFVCLDPNETTRFQFWSMQGLLAAGSHDFTCQPLFVNNRMMWGFTFTMTQKL